MFLEGETSVISWHYDGKVFHFRRISRRGKKHLILLDSFFQCAATEIAGGIDCFSFSTFYEEPKASILVTRAKLS